MIVEVRPGAFSNKGGELMMRAIAAELARDASLAVEPWVAPFPERARLGLLQKLRVRRLGPAADVPAIAIPRRIRGMFGIVAEGEISAVLDATGFRYTDSEPRGLASSRELAANSRRWHRRGIRVVLLPQAFGPFEDRRVRKSFEDALAHVDAVYARDRVSFEHLAGLRVRAGIVRRGPDVSVGLDGVIPPNLQDLVGPGPYACIVPNVRMVELTSRDLGTAYAGFLERTVAAVAEIGLSPILVVHETARDLDIARALADASQGGLRVVIEDDPLRLKGVLGSAAIVIGSRYHALVSALSQGVPALGTGWSHKYAGLFEDFGCPENLVDARIERGELRDRVAGLVEPAGRAGASTRLLAVAARQRGDLALVWQEIRDLLGVGRSATHGARQVARTKLGAEREQHG